MTDDDDLDPVLVDRFRALDDLVAPDTWPGGHAGRIPRARRWLPIAAAAAAVVLVVGAVVLLRGDREGSIVGAPVTSASSTTTTAPTTPLPSVPPTSYVVEMALAVAEPAIVAPGGVVTITPAAIVQRYCTDIVEVLPAGEGTTVGQILDGATWFAVREGAAGPTWPACIGETTAAPLTVAAPPITDGTYRFCIAEGAQPQGCAVVTLATTDDQPIAPLGTATPTTVVPGQVVSIAPAEPVLRACTDVVSVYSGPTFLGSVGGPRFRPSPGEGDTLAACEGDVSGEPIEVFVPRLAPGRYVFCASDDLLPAGCAQVDVLASTLLATVTSSEVANGDTITITPAGEIERICEDRVRVVDATRATRVVQITDVTTGASEPPAFGGWEAPDCEPKRSGGPLTIVVPDVGTGAYAFCLSADLADASCALVYVTEKRFDPPPASTVPVTGQGFEIEVSSHCGFNYLSQMVDGRSWMTDEAVGTFEWGPVEWADVTDRSELVVLEVVLSDDRSVLIASANGRSVRYRPVTADDPQFFCA